MLGLCRVRRTREHPRRQKPPHRRDHLAMPAVAGGLALPTLVEVAVPVGFVAIDFLAVRSCGAMESTVMLTTLPAVRHSIV